MWSCDLNSSSTEGIVLTFWEIYLFAYSCCDTDEKINTYLVSVQFICRWKMKQDDHKMLDNSNLLMKEKNIFLRTGHCVNETVQLS